MRLIRFCVVVVMSLVADVAVAQTASASVQPLVVLRPSSATPQELASSQISATASGEASSLAVPQEAPEVTQKKQQLLQQLYFDRRSSSILRAWALPAAEAMKPALQNEGAMPPTPVSSAVRTPAAVKAPEAPVGELTEEQKAAKAAAEAAVKKTEADQKAFADFQAQLQELQFFVTKGDWPVVAENMVRFSEADRNVIYDKLLQSLIQGTPDSPRSREGQVIGERNLIRATDVIAIAELCPLPTITPAQRLLLGQLATACQAEGEADYAFEAALREHTAGEGTNHKLTKRLAAQLLFAAGRAAASLEFLPSLEEAQRDVDLESLNLLSDAFLALHAKDADKIMLEGSWAAVQGILATQPEVEAGTASVTGNAEPPKSNTPENAVEVKAAEIKPGELSESERDGLRQKALRRAVMLVPRLREELGQKWLAESFTQKAERGRRILNGIGSAAAKNMIENMSNTDERLATLKLQQTAVEAVLTHSGNSVDEWSPALHLLAVNWLREATYSSLYDTSTSRGPRMQRDEFGNYFWNQETVGFGRQTQNGMPQAIPSGKVLDARPSDAWLKFLEPTFYPTLAISTARLHLRVKEEASAFPFIESLAKTHPAEARGLVENFLNTWAENHDPNSERRRTGMYMFSFGYNERLSGIPLTRSHQERSLRELSSWVQRIRALELKDIDEKWISSAFTKVHSSAEVYRQDDLEAVFGNVQDMKPETLASFLQSMRNNLSTVWRAPQVQQDSGTNRKKKDMEAEVVQGYETALTLCANALAKHPADWQLLMTQGSLLHDLNNFNNDLTKSSSFTEQRKVALNVLKSGADAYVAKSRELKETEYSVEAFNTWFYAALGDSAIGQITPDRNPMLEQMPMLNAAMLSLPEELREKHLKMFANDLFARMSTVNPAVKFRYVREGLKLTGDRNQAREAKQVFDYYSDLVTEIQLKAEIDGTARVGHSQPFGVFVSIRHSKAIERESGGFARYLQNQNSGGGYFYNNGRPNEDYRDKFEKATREALDEHFEVLSVTFEPESINSRSDAEAGWRVTPYAYVLLKARGPEIDRIPSMRLDMDFLDTTGYVVLPVETSAMPVDCSVERGDLRPLSELSLTQTLDEREAKDGKLSLEVKAVGRGLIPPLEDLVDLKFDDFEVTSVEDNKLSVSKFDPDSPALAVLSEHLWTVSLKDRNDASVQKDRTFQFASARVEPKESFYQRYDDADLKAVEQTVTLVQTYDKPVSSGYKLISSIAVGLLCLAGIAGYFLYRSRTSTITQSATLWQVPEDITPFSVLTLLKSIEKNNGMPAQAHAELTRSIAQIERYYFANDADLVKPDLESEAHTWVGKAR